MATNKVQPLDIILGIKGAEKLAALKSSFRDLTKTVKQTDADIEAARKSVNEYAKSANQSEAVIKGQIKAFEGLREQAAMGGKVYRELSNDITELKARLNGSTSAIDAQRRSILELASGAEVTAKQLGLAVDKLFALRNETRLDSAAFNALGKDIDGLNGKIASLAEQTKRTASENRAAALSVSNTLAKTEASAQKQIASSARREQTVRDEILALSEKKKATDELIKKENQLTAAISRRRQLSVQEGAREARRRVRAGAQVYTGAVELGPVDALDQRLGDLPNTTAAFSQRLSELQDRLVNTVRGGDQYIQVALRIAQVQREASAATQGLGAALINDLASGAAVRNQKNLREAIGQLQAEMFELNSETAEGSARYAENARQVNRLQKELDQISNSYRTVADVARQAGMAMGGSLNPFTVAGGRRRATPDFAAYEQPIGPEISPAAKQAAEDRKQEIRDRIANLKRINTENDALREQDAIRRSIAKNREKVAARAGIDRPMREISGLYKGIADIGMSKIAADIDRMGNSYYQVANDIKNATKASNGSINSLQAQRNAWASLRAGLDPTSKAYQDVGREIEKVDRRLEKLNRSRRRMSPMQMTQAAGAVLSGGIFGGPEGFIGGAVGALGGVGGAFAGAAIGAQVGGIRRTLGEYTEYAAQIARLKIALEGIAGSQDQYNRALAAAADVTKSLNVPQDVAIQGITRLTAAVKGADGSVADAELAFKNINSAIIATGGGAEQVQGAVTALVQIFSKGKVSAEEINQIAERLPGTFNKIAAASGRTGPELTKALQDGKVGLNDLMKFLVSLGDEYGDLAAEIAGSQENAGARLQVAFDQMRVDVGNALQPIGAEFQNAFAEFIKDITPTLVAVLPKIGELVLGVAKNLDVLAAAAAGAAAAMGLLSLASIKIAGAAGFSAAGVALLKVATAAGKLTIALKGLALLNPFVALGAGAAVLGVQLVKSIDRQKELNRIVEEGKGTNDEMKKTIEDLEERYNTARNRLKGYAGETKATGRAAKALKEEVEELKAQLDKVKGTYEIRLRIKRETDALMRGDLLTEQMKKQGYEQKNGRLVQTVSGIVYDIQTGEKYDPKKHKGLSTFDETKPDGTGTGTGTADKGPKSRLPELNAQHDSMVRGEKGVLEIMSMRQEQAMLLARATADNNQELISTVNLNNISLDFAEKELEIEKKLLDDLDKASKLGTEAEKIRATEIAQRERNHELAKLLLGTEGAVALEKQRAAIAEEERSKAMSDQLFTLREQLGLVTDDERIARFRQEQEKQFGQDDPRVAESTDLFRQTVAPTFAEGLSQKMRELKKDLKELINPINQVAFAADTIGAAFGKAFSDVVTGSASAKEALAGMMQSIGQSFIEMAAQIIAKQTTMIILGTIMKALGIAGGFGGGAPDPNSANVGSVLDSGGFTTGNLADQASAGTFAFGRANGGPVRGGQPYMVGERGPELFVPSTNGGVMRNEDMRQLMGRSPVASNAPAMNFTFETTNIGGQEFVSREQLEAAMVTTRRQAASDGAKRGMNMTLDRMQNSPRTRARVGIS